MILVFLDSFSFFSRLIFKRLQKVNKLLYILDYYFNIDGLYHPLMGQMPQLSLVPRFVTQRLNHNVFIFNKIEITIP